MKNPKVFTVVFLSVALLSGCAGVQKVADKLDMKTGTYVAPEKMATFVKGKTRQADVMLFARVRSLTRLKMVIDELRDREASGRRMGVIAGASCTVV